MNAKLSMSSPVEDMFVHASHELYSPITSLLMVSTILKNDREILSNHQDYELMLDVLDKSCNRLLRTTENVLLYHKIINGTLSISGEHTISPNEVIYNAASNLGRCLNRLDDLRLQLTSEQTNVGLAEKLLALICTEVLHNAFMYSSPKSVVIVESSVAECFYHLSISDKGIGMDETELGLISAFKQFNRAHYEQQGSGLGLTLARLILQLAGGYCTISSKKGVGTTVLLGLPCGV